MSHLERTLCWRVVARSERGTSHIRKRLPNQDAVHGFVLPDGSSPVILAVADGHGSEKCFRSQIGAALAVDATHQAFREFLDAAKDKPISAAKGIVEQQVPTRIIRAWKRRVGEHLRSHPITNQELEPLKMAYGVAEVPLPDSEEKSLQPYGATLLGALITDDFAVYLQLGDGEILVIGEAGDEVVSPIPEDKRLIANETTSLCQEDPLRDLRLVFQRMERVRPALVLLSTDGFPNSFSDPDGLAKFAPKLLQMLCDDPEGTERDYLPRLLRRASDEGSGDDITLAIAFRPISPPTAGNAAVSEAGATPPVSEPAAPVPHGAGAVTAPSESAQANPETTSPEPERSVPDKAVVSAADASQLCSGERSEQDGENGELPKSPNPSPLQAAEAAFPTRTEAVASGQTLVNSAAGGSDTTNCVVAQGSTVPTYGRTPEPISDEHRIEEETGTGSRWNPRNWFR